MDDMTTLIVIDGHKPGGRRSEEVAARFRSELGRLNISASEAARRCRKTQAWMARRTSGKTPFDVDDLDMVCDTLGISYDFVATGIRAVGPPGGGGEPVVPMPADESLLSGSNRRPHAYKEFRLAARSRPHRPRSRPPGERAA